ncbi:hypothetical protein BO70DRAFT_365082 [Aspergillus heteromorphus CBS 117.55]|uniref:Uncharacterized protein n=1 Tax=Aspergillus heteromorphus CBS 117.55 TaxID=1448321 RepID=A0A317VIL1_9EURO|nr:uncharacterized protein BO70DRAFT_365082 [Aspergillus heteromorphus CBS 117.55]PWY71680.1 hypothetical protein BO70DRAFT_365082 [Aspergillus heteromorphus CBS 117.55]
MDFQKHHPHPPYHPHPSLLSVAAHDPRVAPPAPPARAYGPPHPASPRGFYDPFPRREPEMPRSGVAPAYSYPTPSSAPASVPSASYAHESAYAGFRTDGNGYHISPANHGSLKEQNPPGGNLDSDNRHDPNYNPNYLARRDRRVVYREGRRLAFFF